MKRMRPEPRCVARLVAVTRGNGIALPTARHDECGIPDNASGEFVQDLASGKSPIDASVKVVVGALGGRTFKAVADIGGEVTRLSPELAGPIGDAASIAGSYSGNIATSPILDETGLCNRINE